MSQADAADSTPAPRDQWALTLADLNTAVNHEPRVADIRLAEALGMDRPRDIRKLIERHREALKRLGEVCATVAQTSRQGGRPGRTFWLNKRQALFLCTKSETARATEATIQMVEVFDAYLGGTVRVKAHRRALPRPEVSEPPQLRDGQAAVRIAGRTIVIDMTNFDPRGGLAVVFTLDGGMRLDRARQARCSTIRGERVGQIMTPLPQYSGRGVYEAGWIIGTVIEPQMAKGARGRGKTTPRLPAARTPRRALPDLAEMEMAGAA